MGAVWLVASQLRRLISRSSPVNNKQKHNQQKNQPQSKAAAELVCCDNCGTYVPEVEAVRWQNCYYCSEACKN